MGKRGAERQITKDDDSEDEEGAPVQFGTFKRASEEVLASRKIVKVKRTAASSNSTPPNPFASIQMGLSEDKAKPVAQPSETDVKVPEEDETTNEVKEEGKGEGKGENESVNGHGKEEGKSSENGEKGEVGTAGTETKELTSFQQVSTAPNAFGTFTTTSGFSFSTTPSFSFGTTTAFSFGGSSSSPSSFSFGGSSSAGGFSFSAPSLSSAPSSSSGAEAPAVQPNYATVTLQEVSVETGEEKENPVFISDAVLYEFVDQSWKERGKGEFKLNVSEDMKARLLMRSKGNLKLLLNAGLFPDMKTTKMDARSVTFACVNSATGKEGLTTYALKVRDAGAMSQLLELIEHHKSVQPASAAPTPATTEENSQPASGAEEKSEAPSKSQVPAEGKVSEETKDPDEAV